MFMRINIFVENTLVNEMTIDEWRNSVGDDEYFQLLDGELSIDDSIAKYNQSNRRYRAEISGVEKSA